MTQQLFSIALFIVIAAAGLMVPTGADGETGSLGTTGLGNIVYGRNSQFNWFTKGFDVDDVSDIAWPDTIARRVINVVFSFLGIIAVIVIIYAGFLWLTAGGEEEKAKQGRTLLFQAAIGLIIVLAAWLIAYFVIDQLAKAIVK